MALTELQIPTKAEFYRDMRSLANLIAQQKLKYQEAADFINRVQSADLDAMGVPAGQIRTDLVDLKNVLNELVSYYNGNAVTPAKNPDTVVDSLRTMIIV